ncbi:hypothetical protein ACT7V1_001126 [Salmonella enterica subsp. enterica]|uniref:hypothetical protein n=1 Tax=Enterobacter mori TaxID=539813 RepID=UPI0015E4D69D|nr:MULTISPECIES: hypothetical protein [Enterobacteriaceae]QLO06836.1 hypothetical protein HV141_25545 [Citrobacter freundii]VVY57592.1 Uncharacterised protein [Escherichia coli]VVZ64064.1 Uncharacterised protein [Escherichia coli]VWN03592.1 Uncharacterised protein [Escherichia coli]
MIKTAAIALLFGFIGAALFGRLFPPASPYDYVAVINFMDDKGHPLGEAQSRLVLARAEKLSKAGYLVLNASALYSYPTGLQIPQTISTQQ